MDKHQNQTKPISDRRIKSDISDWEPIDVIAEIWRRKSSLRRLSRLNGYKGDGLKVALRRPWPKAEQIIAQFLGVLPQAIWPSRYDQDGTPNRRRGNPNWTPGYQRIGTHVSAGSVASHVKKAVAN